MTQTSLIKFPVACVLAATLAGCQVSETVDDLGQHEFTVTIDSEAINSAINDYTSGNSGSSSSSSEVQEEEPDMTLVLEEGDYGYCYADGDLRATGNDFGIETTYSGYNGMGYTNSANVNGASIIWHVDTVDASMYEAEVRYSSCCDDIRPAAIKVNGEVVIEAAPFERTRAWDTWFSQALSIPLEAGANTIELIALTDGGLPNIDSLTLVGKEVAAGVCDDAVMNTSSVD